ncbi:MAG: metal ABC transporter substrate-binding protein [Acidimicrobiia bacterium]
MRTFLNKALLVLIAAPLALGACSANRAPVPVLTTVYPAQFVAERLTGTAVANLTPAGAEPHDLELSPRQVEQVLDADLVLAWSTGFQPAVDDALRRRTGPSNTLVDALNPADRARATRDPHVWLDPVSMRTIARAAADAISSERAESRTATAERQAQLDAELVALDAEFRNGLAQCARRTIVTAHEAFGWLAERYNFTQEGIAGIDPEQEPDAKRVAEIAALVRRESITTIFTEEAVSPRIAETLAREASGVQIVPLSTLEVLSAEERQAGDDYFSLMRANLAKLRTALGCS